MTADTLRASIEAALRQRDPSTVVELEQISSVWMVKLDSDLTTGSTQHRDPVEALRRLARGHGLLVSDDGAVTDALDEVVRLRKELAAARAALQDIAPKCAACGALASCVGSYEGERESHACDDCCGHGSEDGHCTPVNHADALRAAGDSR